MRSLLPPLLALTLVACSGGDDAGSAGRSARREAARPDRCDDPRVVALRSAIDLLREEEALDALDALEPELDALAGVEADLLRARVLGMQGELTAAQPYLESARERAPEDPRVYATACELYAAPGQFETALKELQEGLNRCGDAPELLRAHGVLLICRPEVDTAERGLGKLDDAILEDPDLPFVQRPLGQAHLLVGRRRLAEGDADAAFRHVTTSLEYDPAEADSWHFLAEVYSARNDYEAAVGVLEELVHEIGRPLQAELALTHKKAGTQALVSRERPRAIEHFLAARRLGLDDEELGFGAQVLRDEAVLATEAGLAALAQSDLTAAREHFEQALSCDPESLAARNHLGIVQFKTSDLAGAVESWRRVLIDAQALDLELPDPVHIHLAKALLRLDDEEGALLTLEDYLLEQPFGEFVDETREMVSLLQEH